MGSRYLLDLADVCRYAGYAVVEVDGWQTNARGSGGYDPGYPNHLIVHHTASGPSSDPWGDVNYCAYGHTDAPVGNLYLSRDGTVYVMAAGAANTNGTGLDPCGLVPDDGMNSRSIAIEAANEGTGEPWPEDQQDSYRRLCAALLAAYGIGVAQLHSHQEWTTGLAPTPPGTPSRKIDPAGESAYATGSACWDMNAFRRDVAVAVAGAPEPEPEPGPLEGDTMPLLYPCDDGSFYVVASDLSTKFPIAGAQARALRTTGLYADVLTGDVPIDLIEDARTAGDKEQTQ